MSYTVKAIRVINATPEELEVLRANCVEVTRRRHSWILHGEVSSLFEDTSRVEVLGEGEVDDIGGPTGNAIMRQFLSLIPYGVMPKAGQPMGRQKAPRCERCKNGYVAPRSTLCERCNRGENKSNQRPKEMTPAEVEEFLNKTDLKNWNLA